jgi:glycosyltransferase involved in cell wall biosynthesis
MPLISVIIPTHNRATVLARAVDSVARQKFADWELVVVDDGSTDQTPAVLDGFRGLPMRVFKTPNRGVSQARNLGAQNARGEWLAFLDSDDEWLPNRLSDQVRMISRFRWIHGEEIWVRGGVRVNAGDKYKKSGGRIFSRCVDLCFVSPSASLIERRTFEQAGGFRPGFPVCEDYDLWLRLSARFEAGFIETPVVIKYGGHEDQLSRRFPAMDFWRVKSLMGVLKSPFISLEERQHVARTILIKTDILIKGYKKHSNFENMERVQEWRELAASSANHNTHSAMERLPLSEPI